MTVVPIQRITADPQGVGRRLAAASDERRRLVERVMHDGVQQNMALLGLKLSMLQKVLKQDPNAADALCEEVRGEIQSALRELRVVAHLMYPAILDNEGLAAALKHATDRLGIAATVEVDEVNPLPHELDAALYFCCLEALDNAARHAGPGVDITVRVHAGTDDAGFEVVDAGHGFTAEDLGVPSGLQHIADRIEALNGVLTVDSSDHGTVVRATVPLH